VLIQYESETRAICAGTKAAQGRYRVRATATERAAAKQVLPALEDGRQSQRDQEERGQMMCVLGGGHDNPERNPRPDFPRRLRPTP
jgi:hypothetical protein